MWTDLQFFKLGSQECVAELLPVSNRCDAETFSDSQDWKALAEYEKYAPTMEVISPPQVKEWHPVKKIPVESPVRTINKFYLVTTVLCAAALFLMILYVRLTPPASYKAAMVLDSMDALWSSDLPISPGTRVVSSSRPIRLTQGIVKLQTDDLVQIVLEAPAEFYFTSYSEIAMNYGKLFAHVSKQGSGFSVVTPKSKIVDMGTEFGVLCHINGDTEFYLYKGRANLIAGEKFKPKTTQLLTAGSARRVDFKDCSIHGITLDEEAVVRDIHSGVNLVWQGQKAIQLADLLLGGDGFGTASRWGISYELDTGQALVTGDSGYRWYRPGPGKMIPFVDEPYLDCLFVPGTEGGAVPISTEGHRFLEAPPTTGLYYANVSCLKYLTFFDPVQKTFDSKKQYPDSGALYLHSNIGMTVDLDAVRRVIPGLRISSFSAFAGILRMADNAPDFSEVDVWVLVDGRLCSSYKKLRADQGYDIHVDIEDRDRFLTLIVTDGGKSYVEGKPANHLDTCGFAEPVFNLESLPK
jgi:hypothetical protein